MAVRIGPPGFSCQFVKRELELIGRAIITQDKGAERVGREDIPTVRMESLTSELSSKRTDEQNRR
jgi:hypothetical protein